MSREDFVRSILESHKHLVQYEIYNRRIYQPGEFLVILVTQNYQPHIVTTADNKFWRKNQDEWVVTEEKHDIFMHRK